MGELIPDSHPRKASLLGRRLLTEAAAAGMLADSALIAHGRGEAFDYLLAERTHELAAAAIEHAAALLAHAQRPCLTINGNTAALAADDLLRCAAVLAAPIELNLYYRTDDRVNALMQHLQRRRDALITKDPPQGWASSHEAWSAALNDVPLLGDAPDMRFPGLDGPRALCTHAGMGTADVVFVPLEDGDRCEALVRAGLHVIVVDLNPLSRTARTATVTIVDELRRTTPRLLLALIDGPAAPGDWDNGAALAAMLEAILAGMTDEVERLRAESL